MEESLDKFLKKSLVKIGKNPSIPGEIHSRIIVGFLGGIPERIPCGISLRIPWRNTRRDFNEDFLEQESMKEFSKKYKKNHIPKEFLEEYAKVFQEESPSNYWRNSWNPGKKS